MTMQDNVVVKKTWGNHLIHDVLNFGAFAICSESLLNIPYTVRDRTAGRVHDPRTEMIPPTSKVSCNKTQHFFFGRLMLLFGLWAVAEEARGIEQANARWSKEREKKVRVSRERVRLTGCGSAPWRSCFWMQGQWRRGWLNPRLCHPPPNCGYKIWRNRKHKWQ